MYVTVRFLTVMRVHSNGKRDKIEREREEMNGREKKYKEENEVCSEHRRMSCLDRYEKRERKEDEMLRYGC